MLWIASELYYPETTSTGYILTRVAEQLAAHFTVKVLCGQPSYSARGTKSPRIEVHNGVQIRRCWATTLPRDRLMFRLLNALTISASIFSAAVRSLGRRDVVLVVTNPPILPSVVLTACRLRGAQCCLIVHDVYPDLAIAAGKLREDSMLGRIWAWLNGKIYSQMSRIFVLGRDMKELVRGRVGVDPGRVVIARNWADLQEVLPRGRSKVRLLRRLGLLERFVVQYAGNMGHANDVEAIIDAATQLKERPDIHFLLIGSGAKVRMVLKEIERRHLSNVTFLGQRPREEQCEFLNACDVQLVALVRGMKGVSVPSRMYNALAAGKPIIAIAEAGSELAMVVHEEQIGWLVEPGAADQLVDAILQAAADRTRLAGMGLRARAAAEEKYSLERVVGVFESALQELD